MCASPRTLRVRRCQIAAVPVAFGIMFGAAPAFSQALRPLLIEPIRASAEVVPQPAQFGPLVATLLNTSVGASALQSTNMAVLPADGGTKASPAAAPVTIEAVEVFEAPANGGSTATQQAPATSLDPASVAVQGSAPELVRSYLVAAAGTAGLPTSMEPGSTWAASQSAANRAMIQIYDGQSGRSVVVPALGGLGDGRLSITVVFN